MNFSFKLVILFIFVIFSFTGPVVFAVKGKPLLVIDGVSSSLPKRFRTTNDPIPLGAKVSRVGLSSLRAIGSGQFSIQQLEKIMKRISDPMVIVDLRQESHGFVNGIPVSWYGNRNWTNHGKDSHEVESIQSNLLDKLRSAKVVRVHTAFQKREDGKIKEEKVSVLQVKTVLTEREWITKLGLQYHRFFIPDHSSMTNVQVDQFVQFVKTIPKGRWVYFHCRGGSGRTTSLMVMYDMMRNAKNTSLSDILKRQELLGGRDLISGFDGYKLVPGKKRLQLMEKFYEYCRMNQDNFQTSWTSWLKSN